MDGSSQFSVREISAGILVLSGVVWEEAVYCHVEVIKQECLLADLCLMPCMGSNAVQIAGDDLWNS